jgi:hypothetical protein
VNGGGSSNSNNSNQGSRNSRKGSRSRLTVSGVGWHGGMMCCQGKGNSNPDETLSPRCLITGPPFPTTFLTSKNPLSARCLLSALTILMHTVKHTPPPSPHPNTRPAKEASVPPPPQRHATHQDLTPSIKAAQHPTQPPAPSPPHLQEPVVLQVPP